MLFAKFLERRLTPPSDVRDLGSFVLFLLTFSIIYFVMILLLLLCEQD